MQILGKLTLLGAGCALCACSHAAAPGASSATEPLHPRAQSAQSAPADQHLEDPGNHEPAPISRAVAILQPTRDQMTRGKVTFTKREDGGLDVNAQFTGLPPGKHAYHVHQFGDCSGPDGKTAGPHFHFGGSSEHPEEKIITGNLGDVEASQDGTATGQTTIVNASLQGPYSVVGRGVIVHEKQNDPAQPPLGGAGKPLACGVIGVADR